MWNNQVHYKDSQYTIGQYTIHRQGIVKLDNYKKQLQRLMLIITFKHVS